MGGARRAASDRVLLRCRGEEVEGWTLNVSRGGLRVVIERPLRVEDLVDVVLGDPGAPPRPGRVAWIKAAPDGQILGLQFLDTTGSIPPLDDDP